MPDASRTSSIPSSREADLTSVGRTSLPTRLALIVFVLALTVRIAYSTGPGAGLFQTSADGLCYLDLAKNLVSRHTFVTDVDPPHRLDLPFANRPPLTPFFLAAVFSVFGTKPLAAQIAFAIVGALGCVLTAALTTRLFGLSAGLLAGALAIANPFFIYLSAIPLTENLAVTLYAGLGLMCVALGRSIKSASAWACGALCGLAALNKPTIFPLLPLLAIWLACRGGVSVRQRAIAIVSVIGGALIVLAPWTVRNLSQLGRLAPVTTQTASVMYQGVGFHADYPITKLEEGATGWYNQPGYADALGSPDVATAVSPELQATLVFVRNHPGKFLEQAFRKERLFWAAYPNVIHQVSWAALALFAVAGVLMTRHRWRELVPIYLLILQTAAIPVFFTSMPRFRAPIEPLLLMFAAVPLRALIQRETV